MPPSLGGGDGDVSALGVAFDGFLDGPVGVDGVGDEGLQVGGVVQAEPVGEDVAFLLGGVPVGGFGEFDGGRGVRAGCLQVRGCRIRSGWRRAGT